jgi:hypothetical protein
LALDLLPASETEYMRKPLFVLKDMTSRLGYWSLAKREIGINRNLAFHHGWDEVRDVLLHEMAHQLTEEVWQIQSGRPHGRIFRKACRLLRADPKASGHNPSLCDRIYRKAASPDDKLIARIQKLMALAESDNQHEAEAAMVKAHALIAKYNLDLIESKFKSNYFSIFLGRPKLRHPRETYHLASLLQDFYFVEGIWVSTYVVSKGKMGRVLEISGRRHNLQTASYVYDFIHRYIQRSWARYNQHKGLNRYRKTDYAVGVIEGFRQKLSTEREASADKSDTRALLHLKDAHLADYIADRYPRLRQIKRTASSQDDTVLADGLEAGQKLLISKGISQKGKKVAKSIAYHPLNR